MKLCDRCLVSGCCLDYLGKACQSARKKTCPDVRPNRAELIANMSLDQMAEELIPMFEELCEDGIPSPEYMRCWLMEEEDLW